MLFNSYAFLLFFPLFGALYFALHGRRRLWLCLVASYIFYGWWDWRFLFIIAFSSVLDYTLGLRIGSTEDGPARKTLLIGSIVSNLGILAIFKYFNFFISSLASASNLLGVGWDVPLLRIVLPVGISFFTFQSMSYTIDVYWRHIEPERDLVRFATFVAFFPQLVAGPIVRAIDLLPQLRRDHPFEVQRVTAGLQLMAWGYFKKVAVADSLSAVVDARFAMLGAHGTLSLFIGIIFYAFQIYCDFSGYSDIAIGAAGVLGFDFGVNFRKPYFSKSFSEFWTRWHISLSTWLRDYLYIPLGGNRRGRAIMYRNLMIVMLLGGLWHGASWTFVVWGCLHGLYLVAQRLIAPAYRRASAACGVPDVVRDAVALLIVFTLTCFAWIFFRAPTLAEAALIIERSFGLQALSMHGVPMAFDVLRGIVLIGILLVFEGLATLPAVAAHLTRPRVQGLLVAASIWAIALLGTFSGSRFIYFQF
jgi:D-alanyl-lipoteichoic acid acyltransferase DltB (MBOAT superfamily)